MPKKSAERMQEEASERQMFAKRLRLAMSARDMTNTDVMNKAAELGYPMRKSKVSQSLSGRFLLTEKRASLWAMILRVNPLWLMGYGLDDEIMLVNTPEEDTKDLNELIRLYTDMSSQQRKLLLQIAREFRFPFENAYITVVPKNTDVKIDYKK